MTNLQKIFLLLTLGYLVIKVILALLIYSVTKQVETKGLEFHKKRKALKD